MTHREDVVFKFIRLIEAMSVVTVSLLLLPACYQSNEPASALASSDVGSRTSPSGQPGTCVDSDIECEERFYQLEETLFAYEGLVSQSLHADAQSCWQADVGTQRSIINACDELSCKETALLHRIAALHDLQPAAQRVSFTLPQVPALIAVLPPSLERGTGSSASFEAHGSLIHATEDPEHMGIAVQAGDKQHVFIFEMDMGADSSQDEVIGLVGTSPTTQVLVRGVAQLAPTGVTNFDSSHCRWVYQLPGAPE